MMDRKKNSCDTDESTSEMQEKYSNAKLFIQMDNDEMAKFENNLALDGTGECMFQFLKTLRSKTSYNGPTKHIVCPHLFRVEGGVATIFERLKG